MILMKARTIRAALALSLLLLTIINAASASDYQDYELANDDDDEDHDTEDQVKDRTLGAYDYENCGRAPLNPLTKGSQRSSSNASAHRMTHGTRQLYGEWPSYVRLVIRLDYSQVIFCGGVIISNRHILTAAHCVLRSFRRPFRLIDARSMMAILAEDRTGSVLEKRVDLEHVCMAPKFKAVEDESVPIGVEVLHDYAILTTREEIQFNDHIQPACLPSPSDSHQDDPRAICYLVGAGVKSSKGSIMERVETVQKQPMKQTSCSSFLIPDNDESRSCWTHRHGPGSSCKGDSGGPILCLNKQTKRWTVAALPSYGPKDCGYPDQWLAVNTRVGKLLPQIRASCGI